MSSTSSCYFRTDAAANRSFFLSSSIEHCHLLHLPVRVAFLPGNACNRFVGDHFIRLGDTSSLKACAAALVSDRMNTVTGFLSCTLMEDCGWKCGMGMLRVREEHTVCEGRFSCFSLSLFFGLTSLIVSETIDCT